MDDMLEREQSAKQTNKPQQINYLQPAKLSRKNSSNAKNKK